MLDNITLFWLTNTAISAARLYWENKTTFFAPFNVSIPVAVSAFPDELYQCPRSWAEKAYPKLIHYNKLAQGRALRGLGAAAVPYRRAARGLQIAAPIEAKGQSAPARRLSTLVTAIQSAAVRCTLSAFPS